MANTFRKVYKKTGNSGSAADYQLVGNIGVNGVELDIMKGISPKTISWRRKLYLNWGWCVESN